MRRSNTVWNAMLDLDYVIELGRDRTKVYTEDWVRWYKQLGNLKLAFQFAEIESEFTKHKARINLFIISQRAFRLTHGYDTSFGWNSGYDFTLFSQLDEEITAPATKLLHIAKEVNEKNDTNFSNFKALRDEYIKEGLYSFENGWVSEKVRLSKCIEIPKVRQIR